MPLYAKPALSEVPPPRPIKREDEYGEKYLTCAVP